MNTLDELLARYFDGSISSAESAELADQVGASAESAREFVTLHATERLLEAEFQPLAPESAAEAILAQLRAEQAPLVRSVIESIHRSQAPASPWWRHFRQWLAWLRAALGPAAIVSAGMAALAAMVFLGFRWLGPGESTPEVLSSLDSQLSNANGASLRPAVGQHLHSGDLIETGQNGQLTVAYGIERTVLALGPNSSFTVLDWSRGKHFQLRAGVLHGEVARQRLFRALLILTPQAEVRVVGTSFALSVTTNETRLEVTQGKVQITSTLDKGSAEVSAGNYAVAAPNYQLIPQPLTGQILREYWTNLPGNFFVDMLTGNPRYPGHPDGREYLDKFQAPSNWGQNYGVRIGGYLHPPQTGEYTFWISGSSGGLFLSTNDLPANKLQIGTAQDSEPLEWTHDPFQQSPPIRLVAGHKYYIEVLQKHGRGPDHLAVAWRGPNREREVIPGKFLSPVIPIQSRSQ